MERRGRREGQRKGWREKKYGLWDTLDRWTELKMDGWDEGGRMNE